MQTSVWFCHSILVVDTLKYFLNSALPFSTVADARMIWLSLLGVQRTKDSSSLSIVWKRLAIAVIGLNFAGAVGVGKKVQNTRSKSRLSKFFATAFTGLLEEEVRAVFSTREGVAAVGGAMVERGDRSLIHVGSRRKAYQVENDFLIFTVPELCSIVIMFLCYIEKENRKLETVSSVSGNTISDDI